MTTQANRRVLFAVELLDPIAGTVVTPGMDVQLDGVAGRPIVNASGRFVWLEQRGDAWPKTVRVTSRDARFGSAVVPVKSPADPQHPTPSERLARVLLQPTPAYPFDAGITTVRGRVTESKDDDTPVAGARVVLGWSRDDAKWVPPFPPTDKNKQPPPVELATDARGEFAVYARIPAGASPDVDKDGFVAVRVQVTRPELKPPTRVTPPSFPFVPKGPDGKDHDGRVPEGRLLTRDVRLRWSELTAL